eukprot:CAMPEP_0167793556 /NCGR_PEP_ID=MMETSP0111_2-20121227/13260_1 /TAXON_ID=91324 /ORGANISM="Lotharella globosa, Strain CCCM811" /LENGTH=106 /DNA_ID=CAMNT_0007686755 /DNA_START=754 /DNA_END=1070 /DNA_ORIENTATION=+
MLSGKQPRPSIALLGALVSVGWLFHKVVNRTAECAVFIPFYVLQGAEDSFEFQASFAVTVEALPPPMELVEQHDEFLRFLRPSPLQLLRGKAGTHSSSQPTANQRL